MRFTPHGKLAETTLKKFEASLNLRLPDDYRKFLLASNGGAFSEGYPQIETENELEFSCDAFFGLGVSRALDLAFWMKEFGGELPEHSLLVGKTPDGAFLLLCLERTIAGVYLYDHAYELSVSSDDENTFFICSTFSKLTKLVGISPSRRRGA